MKKSTRNKVILSTVALAGIGGVIALSLNAGGGDDNAEREGLLAQSYCEVLLKSDNWNLQVAKEGKSRDLDAVSQSVVFYGVLRDLSPSVEVAEAWGNIFDSYTVGLKAGYPGVPSQDMEFFQGWVQTVAGSNTEFCGKDGATIEKKAGTGGDLGNSPTVESTESPAEGESTNEITEAPELILD